MTEYSKYNIVYRLQKWMDSVPGQTFLNYAYSWGASVVILGTLFKLTHLPGANIMLFAGMGTEVFVFFLSAFDRPFDKTQIGKDLPTHLEDEEDEETVAEASADGTDNAVQGAAQPVFAGNVGGGTIIIGNAGSQAAPQSEGQGVCVEAGESQAAAQVTLGGMPGGAWVAGQQQSAPELAEAQSEYVEELKKLTETLQKVSEQGMRLTRDSEEMENLNRTLTGICKVYEMQLKGASQQIGTIDQINDQSRKMAEQIEQLNSIYARMIEAMTVNMNLKAKE